MIENQTFSVRFPKGSGCGLVSRNCGSLDATISLAKEGPLHGQANPLGRTEGPLHGQARPSARSGPLTWTYRGPIATLRKRSFYYIGYQKEKSRTPPFKSSERLEMGTFSTRFAMGLGRGLTSRISARRGCALAVIHAKCV